MITQQDYASIGKPFEGMVVNTENHNIVSRSTDTIIGVGLPLVRKDGKCEVLSSEDNSDLLGFSVYSPILENGVYEQGSIVSILDNGVIYVSVENAQDGDKVYYSPINNDYSNEELPGYILLKGVVFDASSISYDDGTASLCKIKVNLPFFFELTEKEMLSTSFNLVDIDGNIVTDTLVPISSIVVPKESIIKIEKTIGLLKMRVQAKDGVQEVVLPEKCNINNGKDKITIQSQHSNSTYEKVGNAVLLSAAPETRAIIKKVFSRKLEGRYLPTNILYGSNCARFREGKHLDLKLSAGDLLIDYDKPFSIFFFVRDMHNPAYENYVFTIGDGNDDFFTIALLPNWMKNTSTVNIHMNPQNPGSRYSFQSENIPCIEGSNGHLEGQILMTYDPCKGMDFYCNNEHVGRSEITSSEIIGPIPQHYNAYIGKAPGYSNYCLEPDICIAGFGIINRVATEEEVQKYFQGTIPASPILYLPFAEGGGTKIYNAGTHKWVQENIVFNGVDSKIEIPNTGSWCTSTKRITAVIKPKAHQSYGQICGQCTELPPPSDRFIKGSQSVLPGLFDSYRHGLAFGSDIYITFDQLKTDSKHHDIKCYLKTADGTYVLKQTMTSICDTTSYNGRSGSGFYGDYFYRNIVATTDRPAKYNYQHYHVGWYLEKSGETLTKTLLYRYWIPNYKYPAICEPYDVDGESGIIVCATGGRMAVRIFYVPKSIDITAPPQSINYAIPKTLSETNVELQAAADTTQFLRIPGITLHCYFAIASSGDSNPAAYFLRPYLIVTNRKNKGHFIYNIGIIADAQSSSPGSVTWKNDRNLNNDGLPSFVGAPRFGFLPVEGGEVYYVVLKCADGVYRLYTFELDSLQITGVQEVFSFPNTVNNAYNYEPNPKDDLVRFYYRDTAIDSNNYYFGSIWYNGGEWRVNLTTHIVKVPDYNDVIFEDKDSNELVINTSRLPPIFFKDMWALEFTTTRVRLLNKILGTSFTIFYNFPKQLEVDKFYRIDFKIIGETYELYFENNLVASVDVNAGHDHLVDLSVPVEIGYRRDNPSHYIESEISSLMFFNSDGCLVNLIVNNGDIIDAENSFEIVKENINSVTLFVTSIKVDEIEVEEQGSIHHNLIYGYHQNEEGVYVPGLIDEEKAADDNPIKRWNMIEEITCETKWVAK